MREFLKTRFYLTPNCPYKCKYCHNEGVEKEVKDPGLLSSEDYVFIAGILKKYFRLKCVTFTGGDPFLYPGLEALAGEIKKLNLETVVLTKGLPVYKRLISHDFDFSSFDYVYFSVDTLNKKKYSEICGVPQDSLDKTIYSIDELRRRGTKVRINCVVGKDDYCNPNEIVDMLEFAKQHNVSDLRFIEQMDIRNIQAPFIEQTLHNMGIKIPLPQKPYNPRSLIRSSYDLQSYKFDILRCMCSVALFCGEATCYKQDLMVDCWGRINTCFLDNGKYSVPALEVIKDRDEMRMKSFMDSFQLSHSCPVIEG